MKVDVTNVVETIRTAAGRFRYTADALDKVADKMYSTGDVTYASEALQEMMNALQNARVDLLVTQPIRAYQHAIEDAK